MILREKLDPEGSMWELLAVYLHFLRTKHNLSCAKVGEVTSAARQTVSHWESGFRTPKREQLEILDQRYGTGHLLVWLLHHARLGHNPDWFRDQLEKEARATELRIWELAWIPGLFQSEAYARAMFIPAGVEDIDGEVEFRTRRQQILHKRPPPLVRACLDQGVIEQPVGGREVMREQLARLLELARLPHITIRIVPRSAGAHLGRDGSFKVMTVDGIDVAYTEAPGGAQSEDGGRLVEDSTEVRSFRVRFDQIGDQALPASASVELIQQVMEAM